MRIMHKLSNNNINLIINKSNIKTELIIEKK